MKILQINTVFKFGSTGRIVNDIDDLLKANGCESYVAYSRGSGETDKYKLKIGNVFSMYRDVLSNRIFDNQGLTSKKATKAFFVVIF